LTVSAGASYTADKLAHAGKVGKEVCGVRKTHPVYR
jgi:hypothetical protein